MIKDAYRKRLELVVCWDISRLGKSMKELALFLADMKDRDVGIVSVRQGHHIQRRRRQPLSQRPRDTRRGFHATSDRSEIGAAGTRPVTSGPFRRYRY